MPRAISRLSLTSIAACAAFALSACGGGGGSSDPVTPNTGTKLTLDQSQAAPLSGSSLVLRAKLIGSDGLEIQGAKVTWTSSNEAVARVVSASDTAPAQAAGASNVGQYAVVQALSEGSADIVASVTLTDGTVLTSKSKLDVKPAGSLSYTLSISPDSFTLSAGAAPTSLPGAARPADSLPPSVGQLATAVVARSDGADGLADLKNWTWSVSDGAAFAVSAAADGKSATVSALVGAAAAAGALTACADTPTGSRICANAALARPIANLPSISFDQAALNVKPGRDSALQARLTDVPGGYGMASQATVAWTIGAGAAPASISAGAAARQVIVSGDPADDASYASTITVTATYPDGRTNSASIPLRSTGSWSRLPFSANVAPYRAIAVDAGRVWTLDAGDAFGARAMAYNFAQDGFTPLLISSVSLAPGAVGLWTVDGDLASIVVQLDSGNLMPTMARYPADFSAGSFPSFNDGGCLTGKARRSYAAAGSGPLFGSGFCPASGDINYWTSAAGVKQPKMASSGLVLATRVFPDGTYATLGAEGYDAGNAAAVGAGAYMSLGATMRVGAIAPAASSMGLGARLLATGDIYAAGLDSATTSDVSWVASNYITSGPTSVDEVAANAEFIVERFGDSFKIAPNAQGAVAENIASNPSGSSVDSFAFGTATVKGQPKLRLGAVMADGTAWIYDQP